MVKNVFVIMKRIDLKNACQKKSEGFLVFLIPKILRDTLVLTVGIFIFP